MKDSLENKIMGQILSGADMRAKERERERQLRNFWGMACLVVIFVLAIVFSL